MNKVKENYISKRRISPIQAPIHWPYGIYTVAIDHFLPKDGKPGYFVVRISNNLGMIAQYTEDDENDPQ